MFKKSIFVFFIFHFFVIADDSYWDQALVRNYVHHSDLQRRWAFAFLAPLLKQLKGNESILDIGCGDGKITADLAKFVPNGFAIGVDPSFAMLNWAKKQYCALEYPNLSFQEGGFLEHHLLESFDMIISTCAFQFCQDQVEGLKNLKSLLKPAGKLWMMFPALDNPSWKQARKTIQSLPKWTSFWQNVRFVKFLDVEECVKLLKETDFHPVRIEKIETLDPFVDRKEFLQFLLGTMNPVVPLDRAEEFYEEVIDEYLRLLPEALKEDGVLEARFSRIEIEAVSS